MRTFLHDDLAPRVGDAVTSLALVLDVVVVIRAERTRVAGGAG